MTISFNCPHCGQAYKLQDGLAGKTATCKKCKQKILVPSESRPAKPPIAAGGAKPPVTAGGSRKPDIRLLELS